MPVHKRETSVFLVNKKKSLVTVVIDEAFHINSGDTSSLRQQNRLQTPKIKTEMASTLSHVPPC